MTNKEKYRQLCEKEGDNIPLFQQYWWMDTVCIGKQWNVLLCENNGQIEGALPYLCGRRWGLQYILQPQLTQYCGPWYNLPKNVDKAEFEHRVGGDLAKQLKELGANIIVQHFSPEVTDWLPFHWEGFCQTTRYTYRLPSLSNPEQLVHDASRARRRGMDEVASLYLVDKNFDAQQFAEMHQAYYDRRGGDLLGKSFVQHVCQTALEQNHALLWALRDERNEVICASFVVYDTKCAYALMSAMSSQHHPNAKTYLFWQIINHLATYTQSFDFEGSMDKGVEFFYRSFGAVQVPYFEVSRFTPSLLHLFVKR